MPKIARAVLKVPVRDDPNFEGGPPTDRAGDEPIVGVDVIGSGCVPPGTGEETVS